MADLLCCGFCGRAFELNSFTDFIDHKVKGCSKLDRFAISILECQYCDFRYRTPLDIITHVQLTHGIMIVKLPLVHSGNPEGDHTGSSTQLLPHTNLKGSPTALDNEQVQVASIIRTVGPVLDVTKETFEGYVTDSPTDPMADSQDENSHTPRSTISCRAIGCRMKCNGTVKRKTCCLIDGGPPCTQFEACPIVETSLGESSPNSEDIQSQFVESEQRCKASNTHETVPPERECTLPADLSPATTPMLFRCQFCTNEFKQKIHLQKHIMSVHFKQKPYKCNVCDYRTVEKSHLTIHVRRHTGERPYACLLCNYRAAQHITLKQHCLKKHRNAFVSCQRCNTRFVTLNQLEKHEKFCCT